MKEKLFCIYYLKNLQTKIVFVQKWNSFYVPPLYYLFSPLQQRRVTITYVCILCIDHKTVAHNFKSQNEQYFQLLSSQFSGLIDFLSTKCTNTFDLMKYKLLYFSSVYTIWYKGEADLHRSYWLVWWHSTSRLWTRHSNWWRHTDHGLSGCVYNVCVFMLNILQIILTHTHT
jgi:hypothetical protein